MGLKFLPRPGHMVTFAGGNAIGQLARYVGRTFKLRTAPADQLTAAQLGFFARNPGAANAYFADEEPIEVDANGPDAAHFIHVARRDDAGLWPADEATAAACGIQFVKLMRDPDGLEWVAAPKVTTAKKSEPKAEA